MKRLNYYQAHKNKKPKRLKKPKINLFATKAAIINSHFFMQHSIIVSQQFNTLAEKTLAIAKNIINRSEAIIELFRETKKNNYERRI